MLQEGALFILCWFIRPFKIAMENGPFIDDFPVKTSIYKGFSMAVLNNQMVYIYVRSEPGRRMEHVAGTFGPCGAKRPLGVCGPLPTHIYIYVHIIYIYT